MFAAANGHIIQVFNFFTGENPTHMQYKGHSGKVVAIHWTEDDTGFVSVGADGNIFEWKLFPKTTDSPHTQEFFIKG
jgi:WD40 repeat protein